METKKTILVTGASGFIGQSLIKHCLATDEYRVVATSRRRPAALAAEQNNLVYLVADIREQSVRNALANEAVDVVVHLAAVVEPPAGMSREEQYDIDVTATETLYAAAADAGVKQFIVTSSGAAYGYHADNPVCLKETDALRGNKEFAYSDHKRILEEKFSEWREQYPTMQQLIFRPGLILGNGVDNQITDLFKKPRIMGLSGTDTPFVIIWDEDVVGAIEHGIVTQQAGVYNLAGDGIVTLPEMAAALGKPFFRLPPICVKAALSLMSRLGLSRYGPEQVKFLQYRPVLDNSALKTKFGYLPRFSSRKCLSKYLDQPTI